MGVPLFLLLVVLLLVHLPPLSCSLSLRTLKEGSSLSVEKASDNLISPNEVFSAGFHKVGINAYCFSIWYTSPLHDGNHTIVWMANRDKPVNGKRSKLSLLKTGNLVLTDAGQLSIWATDTASTSSACLRLDNNGNLVLHTIEGQNLWQSFDSPTNTLLPLQQLSKDGKLVASRSCTNHSSGFYKLFFDDDNVLRLIFNGRDSSSIYWPNPRKQPSEVGRSKYNNRRIAEFDSSGQFQSSDNLKFCAADLGRGILRRLTLDFEGNIRLYSLDRKRNEWKVTWQAIDLPCTIHGICGPNSLCTYTPDSGRRCSCVRGHKMKVFTDWSYGCEPDFKPLSNDEEDGMSGFMEIPHSSFYGYNSVRFLNINIHDCEKKCLNSSTCKGFYYRKRSGNYHCYLKNMLWNGYQSPNTNYSVSIKLPKALLEPDDYKIVEDSHLNCSDRFALQLDRDYKKKPESSSLKSMLWFTSIIGCLEIIGIMYFVYMTCNPSSAAIQSYLQVATGFRRFSYAELKKASHNFSTEIGRGCGGIVYKGILSDNRFAAIKWFQKADQAEAEFLAEVSTIGRINHMNLTEIWGYCADRKHRLLVYEYVEHGSLAKNLYSNTLGWDKRFEIAVGTAKGLAYLHEECLEWVLHCDVKPQNILLDSNYQPKVADFGLSKLLNRGGIGNSSFSRIRGTRGYMAPEWISNVPITSKVDVYSYGVVVLEMVTGRSPADGHTSDDSSGGTEQRGLIAWMKEKQRRAATSGSSSLKELWIQEIVDPSMDGEYDMTRMKILVEVALQCVEEDKDARPTMSQVVDVLLRRKNSV